VEDEIRFPLSYGAQLAAVAARWVDTRFAGVAASE
jgi:hypothetical protein